jgi:Tol biopolymer transport system component
MTASTRLERNLPAILGDLSAGPAPDYLDDVFGRTGRTRQRPAWTFPERWLPMADIMRARAIAPAPPWRLIALALVVIAVLVAAALIVAGAQRRPAPPFGPARNGLIPYDVGGDIYVISADATTTRAVVEGPEYDTSPVYSPDGALIAFTRAVGGVDVDLYVVHDDGTGLTRISPTALTEVVNAFWVPSSRYIGADHVVDGARHLELFDVTGKEPPRELAAGYDADNVIFRPPDAKEIAFRGYVGGKLGLFVMNADGTDIRPLIPPTVDESMDQHLNALAYTSDGAQILYQHGVESTATDEGGCCELWAMNADGTGQHRFDPQAEPGQAGIPGTSWGGIARVSPDGRWVAYWHVFGDRQTQRVSVMRADGTGPVSQVGPELDGNASWIWSPDSTRILLSPAGTRRDVYLVDPETGSYTKAPWQTASELDWQRDAP